MHALYYPPVICYTPPASWHTRVCQAKEAGLQTEDNEVLCDVSAQEGLTDPERKARVVKVLEAKRKASNGACVLS